MAVYQVLLLLCISCCYYSDINSPPRSSVETCFLCCIFRRRFPRGDTTRQQYKPSYWFALSMRSLLAFAWCLLSVCSINTNCSSYVPRYLFIYNTLLDVYFLSFGVVRVRNKDEAKLSRECHTPALYIWVAFKRMGSVKRGMNRI